jgi:hypothetical protein
LAHWLAVFILAFHLINPFLGGQQKATIEFSNIQQDVTFGNAIQFQTQITASEAIQKAFIYIEIQGKDPAFYALKVSDKGLASYSLDVSNPALIRPFSSVAYHFQVTTVSGTKVDSKVTTFVYLDKTISWQKLENKTFQVYWYGQRDVDFGQLALNTAQSGLESAAKLIPATLTSPVRIYIFASAQDLQGARLGAPLWVAGHAAPDMGVILVSVPSGPSQRLELERQLPHELTHILQYQAYGERTKDFPVWLIEGTASAAETNPNPDYASAIRSNLQQDHLLHFADLCRAFPRDASNAFLSYAQSQSFVHYIFKKYGASGLTELYNQYKDGLGCSEGVQAAYGMPLPDLEYQWRLEELGANPAALLAQKLLPYIVMLVLVIGASSLAILLSVRRKPALNP